MELTNDDMKQMWAHHVHDLIRCYRAANKVLEIKTVDGLVTIYDNRVTITTPVIWIGITYNDVTVDDIGGIWFHNSSWVNNCVCIESDKIVDIYPSESSEE